MYSPAVCLCQGIPNLTEYCAEGLLGKYLNQNPVLFDPFDTGKFIDLCKKQ
jgi:hypothetical protein